MMINYPVYQFSQTVSFLFRFHTNPYRYMQTHDFCIVFFLKKTVRFLLCFFQIVFFFIFFEINNVLQPRLGIVTQNQHRFANCNFIYFGIVIAVVVVALNKFISAFFFRLLLRHHLCAISINHWDEMSERGRSKLNIADQIKT